MGKSLPLDEEAREALINMADGDGRAVLTLAEEIWRAARPDETLDSARLVEVVQRRAPIYDKAQDGHYNLISALHKCVRGSDPDAALYYLARMFDAGEDPLFIARRVVRMASEDIGLADPQALVIASAAKDAYDFLGTPEGELAIAQAVVYVATAPKSNALYKAFGAAQALAREHGSPAPPKTILNAPTRLMKREGYGREYQYDHDAPDAFSGQNYWPEAIGRRTLYEPVERGFEREISKRLEYWAKLRKERGGEGGRSRAAAQDGPRAGFTPRNTMPGDRVFIRHGGAIDRASHLGHSGRLYSGPLLFPGARSHLPRGRLHPERDGYDGVDRDHALFRGPGAGGPLPPDARTPAHAPPAVQRPQRSGRGSARHALFLGHPLGCRDRRAAYPARLARSPHRASHHDRLPGEPMSLSPDPLNSENERRI